MRSIIEIGEHSVFVPGLRRGGCALDAGANRGRFGAELAARFQLRVIHVEPNPVLVLSLREQGCAVIDCALAVTDGTALFNIGENDEASSLRLPRAAGSHLVVKRSVPVVAKSLSTILAETKVTRFACVKLDIEGAETDILAAIGPQAERISPQWTVEFHDGEEFGICTRAEVDMAIANMQSAGFDVLLRNWPSRSNVLFLDRRALSIGFLEWLALKLRYQYIARLWRALRGL